jgi:predicted kinase
MKQLILTVGLPRSGKTTWALTTGHPIVCPDSIRYALHGQRFLAQAEPFVWAMAYAMADALFLAGHGTVIVDATNVTARRREAWVERFACVPPKAEISFHVIETDPATCIERARAEADNAIIPVIERMAAEWDLPAPWAVQPAR